MIFADVWRTVKAIRGTFSPALEMTNTGESELDGYNLNIVVKAVAGHQEEPLIKGMDIT